MFKKLMLKLLFGILSLIISVGMGIAIAVGSIVIVYLLNFEIKQFLPTDTDTFIKGIFIISTFLVFCSAFKHINKIAKDCAS